MITALLENYSLGIPADKVLLELTYPQIYALLDKINEKKEKQNKPQLDLNHSTNEGISVVNEFADMWR